MVLGYLNEHGLAQLAVTSRRMYAVVTPTLYDQVTLDEQAIEDVIEAHKLPVAPGTFTPFRHTTSLNLAQKATCRMLPVLEACGDKLEYLTIKGTFVDKEQCPDLLKHLKACSNLHVLEVSGIFDVVLFDIVKHTPSLETFRIGTVFDSRTLKSDCCDAFHIAKSNIRSLELDRPTFPGRSHLLVRHLVRLLAPDLTNLSSAQGSGTRDLRLGYQTNFQNLRTLVLDYEPAETLTADLHTARRLTKLVVYFPLERLELEPDAPHDGFSVCEHIPITI